MEDVLEGRGVCGICTDEGPAGSVWVWGVNVGVSSGASGVVLHNFKQDADRKSVTRHHKGF